MTAPEAELDRVIALREAELQALRRERRAMRSGKAAGRPPKYPERDAQIRAAFTNWDGLSRYGVIRQLARRFGTGERQISRVTRSLRLGAGAKPGPEPALRSGIEATAARAPTPDVSSAAQIPVKGRTDGKPAVRRRRRAQPKSIPDILQGCLF